MKFMQKLFLLRVVHPFYLQIIMMYLLAKSAFYI